MGVSTYACFLFQLVIPLPHFYIAQTESFKRLIDDDDWTPPSDWEVPVWTQMTSLFFSFTFSFVNNSERACEMKIMLNLCYVKCYAATVWDLVLVPWEEMKVFLERITEKQHSFVKLGETHLCLVSNRKMTKKWVDYCINLLLVTHEFRPDAKLSCSAPVCHLFIYLTRGINVHMELLKHFLSWPPGEILSHCHRTVHRITVWPAAVFTHRLWRLMSKPKKQTNLYLYL